MLNDIRFSSRSCFRSFERKILRRERLLLLAAESTSSNNSVNGQISMHETACMAFSLLPFALVGRRIFPTTVDLCRPLPLLSLLLSSILSSSAVRVGHERNAQAPRLRAFRASFGTQLLAAQLQAPPSSSRDSRSSVGRLRIVLPKITSQKLASYF